MPSKKRHRGLSAKVQKLTKGEKAMLNEVLHGNLRNLHGHMVQRDDCYAKRDYFTAGFHGSVLDDGKRRIKMELELEMQRQKWIRAGKPEYEYSINPKLGDGTIEHEGFNSYVRIDAETVILVSDNYSEVWAKNFLPDNQWIVLIDGQPYTFLRDYVPLPKGKEPFQVEVDTIAGLLSEPHKKP